MAIFIGAVVGIVLGLLLLVVLNWLSVVFNWRKTRKRKRKLSYREYRRQLLALKGAMKRVDNRDKLLDDLRYEHGVEQISVLHKKLKVYSVMTRLIRRHSDLKMGRILG